MNKWRWKLLKVACFGIATFFSLLCWHTIVYSQPSFSQDLPSLKIHPLPAFLAKWHDQTNQGNYLAQIESTPLGYLVWSAFPVKVYVQQSTSTEQSAANHRFQQWTALVQQAIAEWQVYFPLEEVADKATADILILRSQPSREVKLNPDTGLYDIPRAVAAQTNYEFYLTENPTLIAQRMTIEVSPNFTGVSLLATIRHELGHALGIWGHSPQETDALYFSQVSDPPLISPRDLNTLKKIYQQPTRLGWEIESDY
ncbi:MAG: peptidase [Cyanobacteria bacterium P01_A01_bin.40]